METCVNFTAALWFPKVYNFHFSYSWTPLSSNQRRSVQESYFRANVSTKSFPRNAYMSQYNLASEAGRIVGKRKDGRL
jgi:hypothetical protein